MDKKLLKEGKCAEEVVEALKYATRADLQASEMRDLYGNWAKQYDQVNSLLYLENSVFSLTTKTPFNIKM